MKRTHTYIPTDHIIEEEESEFTPLEGNDFLNLINSIREVGILQPLIVSPSSNGDDSYVVHAGYNRLRAARELGLKEVPCIIVEDKASVINIRYDTDLYRRQLTREDVKKYTEAKNRKREVHYKNIFLPEIIEMFKAGKLTIDHLRILSCFDHEGQKKFLELGTSVETQKLKEEYENKISELSKKIEEIQSNQVPLEKLQKDIQKKLKEKEEEIERKIKEAYSSESQEKIKEIIEAERKKIEKEYKKELDDVMAELRDMSRAKAQAQEQIDVLKEEINRLKEREKEYELIHQRAKHDLEIAKKTIETALSPAIIKEKIEIAAKDLLRTYSSMVLMDREYFSDKDARELEKVSDQLFEIATEIKNFWQ
ncbi:MAG: hypothetical protein D6726_12435 [Nitrospirae bacterium]|nr:MAG: hypothetical protein D6726_12435 [Nitrospirota bacterium]